MTSIQNLPSRLKELRKKNHYSQEYVAEQLNISRQAISNWENEKSAPDLENLMLLADLYNLSLDELLDGNKDNEPSSEVPVTEKNPFYYLEILGLSVILILSVQFPVLPILLSLIVGIWYKVKKRGNWIVYAVCILCFVIGMYSTLVLVTHMIPYYGTPSIEPL